MTKYFVALTPSGVEDYTSAVYVEAKSAEEAKEQFFAVAAQNLTITAEELREYYGSDYTLDAIAVELP